MQRIILVLFLIFYSVVINAQSKVWFEGVNSINPLSHNSATYIHQDKLGFLWIGTFNGLNKYDGYSFKAYKFNLLDDQASSTNRIISIDEDKTGKLWIKTYDGNYQYFNPATEKFVNIRQKTESNNHLSFTNLYESNDSVICLTTRERGVFFIRHGKNEDELNIFQLGEDDQASNNVNFILQDEKKYFWIGTSNGLKRIHTDEIGKEQPTILEYFKIEKKVDKEDNTFFNAAILGKRIWFGSKKEGLIWFDLKNQNFGKISDYEGFSSDMNLDITAFEVQGENLWIGTSDTKVLLYNKESDSFKEFEMNTNKSGVSIAWIYCDRFNQVWLTTNKTGVTRLNPVTGRFTYYNLSQNLEYHLDDERIRIFEDSKNELWIGGLDIGLQQYNRKRDEFLIYQNDPGDPFSIQSNVVEYIMEDRERNLWIGTNWFGSGLNRMIKCDPAFHHVVPVPKTTIKPQNVVRSIFVDSNGYIWIGNKNGQIYIYNQQLKLHHIIQKNTSSKFTGYNAYYITEDKGGHIWVCTKGAGMFISDQSVKSNSFRYNNITFSTILSSSENENSLNNDNVYDIEFDELNRVWVATYGGGLNLIETGENGEKKFRNFTSENSNLTSNKLRDLVIDRNGRLWLASTFGLNYIDIYENNNFEIHNVIATPKKTTGLSYNDIIMIMEDSKSQLWLATAGGGVDVILNPGDDVFKFKNFSEKDGLKTDFIVSLLEDVYGFIWMGTSSGLTRYNPLNKDIDNFDKKNGLPEIFFSERTSYSSSKGKILFGTINGFYEISPDKITYEDIKPSINLTSFQLNNIEISPADPESPLNKTISYCNAVTLKSNQSNFSIGFSMLSYKSPESNYYAYLLEGFDEDWNYIGTEHKATFTNVPPGEYVFHVKGLDSDLSEYGTERMLEITILPPFWRTKIAILIYVVLLFLIMFFSYKLAIRFVKLKNNLKVEKRVGESKLRFFTNISHEIRTPLTLILNPVDNLISEKNLHPDIRYQLTVVHRNTKRLLRMVNQLLDFRKAQNEKVTLRIQEIDLIPFIHQVFESFESQAKQKNIDFKLIYDENDENLSVWGDIQKLDIVIFNLLSNAFKFTPRNGKISVVLNRESNPVDSIIIHVADTGVGIEKEKLDLIFNRFFVSHTDKNEFQGTGIGLSLCQEYIKLHQGQIRVKSIPNQGTDFTVTLLTGNSHFPEDVIVKQREAYSYTPKIEEAAEYIPLQDDFDVEENEVDLKPHILIVEDDTEMCVYLQHIFEKEYKVTTAKDGQDGLEKATQQQPDLIVTDVMMPRMNGIQLTEMLKKDFSTSHIPIIMLSSKSSVESQVEGLKIGAEAYVPKPFNLELLKSYIQSFITQRKKVKDMLGDKVELKPDEIQVTSRDKEFIEKVLHLINENLSNTDFNVEKLVDKMHISRTLFYTKVKGITGYQPVELIRRIRLKTAAKYIEAGEHTISEIAYMVGYNDTRYFSTSFKKQFGVTPSQYNVE